MSGKGKQTVRKSGGKPSGKQAGTKPSAKPPAVVAAAVTAQPSCSSSSVENKELALSFPLLKISDNARVLPRYTASE